MESGDILENAKNEFNCIMAGKRPATSKISKDRPDAESSPPPAEDQPLSSSHAEPLHSRVMSRPSKRFDPYKKVGFPSLVSV